MKQKKSLKIVLVIIGMILIFANIANIYNINKTTKGYEMTDAICIRKDEHSFEGATYYQRKYVYTVSGQEYTLNTFDTNSKVYKNIKYNPNNPNEAITYEGINALFYVGLIFVCSPFILDIVSAKSNVKLDEIKYIFLRMSKRNIVKITTVCFWGYIALSLTFTLKDFFLIPNWNQITMQYSQFELIIECTILIIGRCAFKKHTSYFNISCI